MSFFLESTNQNAVPKFEAVVRLEAELISSERNICQPDLPVQNTRFKFRFRRRMSGCYFMSMDGTYSVYVHSAD